MRQFSEGDRVVAQSFAYGGSGVITHIDKANLFNAHLSPIQVELDSPDADGHSLKRFSLKEVKYETETH